MKLSSRLLALGLLVLVVSARPAHAQFMWLDSNGDGVNDSKDRLSAVGTPTTVDLFLDTDNNRDGSTAVCDTGDGPLTIQSYAFYVTLSNGTAAFSGFQNLRPTMHVNLGQDSTATEYAHGWGGVPYLSPGTYHLATFMVTLSSSSGSGAVLDIVPINSLGPAV
jgi:hypothetical protein